MRVLFFYPWGKFYPASCGAVFVACNQLAYLEDDTVRLIVCCQGDLAVDWAISHRYSERFRCIRSIRFIDVSVRAFTLRDVLFAFERAARFPEFRAGVGTLTIYCSQFTL